MISKERQEKINRFLKALEITYRKNYVEKGLTLNIKDLKEIIYSLLIRLDIK